MALSRLKELTRAADVFQRVDFSPATYHFEVKIWSGRPSGTAHQGHDLSLADLIADRDQIFGVVGVARGISIAMINFDHLAITIAIARPGDDTGCDGNYLRPLLAGIIHTFVPGCLAGKRIGALSKIG